MGFAEVGLGFDCSVSFFEGGEGDGAVGGDDGVADGGTGLGVESGGDIDGKNEGPLGSLGVDVFDEVGGGACDWAGESGAEEGVDDQTGDEGGS